MLAAREPQTPVWVALNASAGNARAAETAVEPVTTSQRTNATLEALKNPSGAVQYDETNHPRYPAGDPSKRAFTYFVLSGGRFIYASAIRLAVLKFVLSMTVRSLFFFP